MIFIHPVADPHCEAPQYIDMFWQESSCRSTILTPSPESRGLSAWENWHDPTLQLNDDLRKCPANVHAALCACTNTFISNRLLDPRFHSVVEKRGLVKPAGSRALFSTQNDSSAHLYNSDVRGAVSVACIEKLESSSCGEPNDRDPRPGLLAFSRPRDPIHFLLNNNVNPSNGGIA